MNERLAACWRGVLALGQRWRRARRGNVALLFAVSLLPIVIFVAGAIDLSRLADARANLQVAADNAALSGAAAYSEGGASYNTLGLSIANVSFCDATAALPDELTIVSSGATNGATAEVCGAKPGPSISATTDAYTPGTIGYAPNAACTTQLQGSQTFTCGFVVAVTATATLPSLVPALFGISRTITVSAAAANPFINFAKVFSGTSISSGAKYANSVWVYPTLVNSTSGTVDYTTNPGALPDATTCYGGPDQTTCGTASGTVNYVMLANTEYANSQIGSTPFTATNGVTYVSGVVQNPPTPPGVTSTTPLGVAFEGIAGGNLYYNSATPITTPGQYGYSVKAPGNPVYTLGPGSTVQGPAANGCYYPYGDLAYQTVGQVYRTSTVTTGGVAKTTYIPQEPWNQVTHWFYSSYLANPNGAQAPDYQEIQAQQSYSTSSTTLLSVPQDSANNGNIAGGATYNSSVAQGPANCPTTTTNSGGTQNNDVAPLNTTYQATGATNCSVFIAQSSTAGTPTPTPPQYDGACFNPSSTPGAQYGALSCQSYGNSYYFFYWNDMGGAQYDNINYEPDASSYVAVGPGDSPGGTGEGAQSSGDGTVILHCSSSSHIVLIQ